MQCSEYSKPNGQISHEDTEDVFADFQHLYPTECATENRKAMVNSNIENAQVNVY